MSFLNELKRRDVFRVGVAYLAVSWLILQVTDTIVPILELPEWVLRFILLLLLIGFPVALMLAWVYEITPQGVRKTDVEAATRAAAPGQRLNKLIIGSLLAVVVILIVERISVDENADESTVAETSSTDTTALSPTAIESPRIAVLPFSNVSADPDQEFFSDGMTDELITLLTKVPGLSVAARTSTFSFKGEMADIPTIAAALGATHVLEGSVRTAGNQLRISLNLINASDGYNLWSETYDRKLDDVFAVQSDIAASVTDALQITLLGDPLYLRQTSPEAYSLYLKARYFDNLKGAENWEKAISHYQQALAIDPDYAPAWAGLSIVYRYQANVGLRELDAGMTLAREAAQKALALDEDLAIAWSNLAQIEMLHRRDWDAATRAADQALRIEPGNSDVLNHAAGLQFVLGNTDQAIALLQQAIEIDPLSLSPQNALGIAYMSAGRFSEAEAAFRQLEVLSPDYPWVAINLARVRLLQGDAEGALSMFKPGIGSFWDDSGVIMALDTLGRSDEAEALLPAFIDRYGNSGGAFQVATIYAWRDDKDNAFDWLDRSYEEGEPSLIYVPSNIYFKNLHSDPRWNELLGNLGLARTWHQSAVK